MISVFSVDELVILATTAKMPIFMALINLATLPRTAHHKIPPPGTPGHQGRHQFKASIHPQPEGQITLLSQITLLNEYCRMSQTQKTLQQIHSPSPHSHHGREASNFRTHTFTLFF